MGRLLEGRHKYYRNANSRRSGKGLALDLRLGLRTQASHCVPSAHLRAVLESLKMYWPIRAHRRTCQSEGKAGFSG